MSAKMHGLILNLRTTLGTKINTDSKVDTELITSRCDQSENETIVSKNIQPKDKMDK